MSRVRFHLRGWQAMMMMMMMLAAAGCGSEPIGQAAGRVTLEGAPLTGASIVFERVGDALAVTCNLAADGAYAMRTSGRDGLPPGEYAVAIRPGITGDGDVMLVGSPNATYDAPPPIPGKYRLTATSGLVAKVQEGSNPPFDFDLSP